MPEVYRFPVPSPLTPDTVLHAAKRLAEADREGYDAKRATIDRGFFVVPARRRRQKEEPTPDIGPHEKFARADSNRQDILTALASGPLRACEIGRKAHLHGGQLSWLLGTLVSRGAVMRDGNRYHLKQ